ncbi:histidine--tRNA ligase, chloroplastic/mitochondrial-like isoform X2 [Panicum virgatum]|uniref:histidine--tRNA ligase, chloroplastic/mitochondrial-like isoform X2 n=1 Tax=Panicum virgatum TaxID=38727 RepID=UPI0019D6860C|nr:histidine--tRNA ligase, chloroplastic/mitochondrial-like isoform X2 [Panicum virgatum]
MAAWSSSPSLRHLLLLRPRVPLSPTCLAGSFSRRHIHSHSRRRLFSSASSSTLTHGDEASTHADADGVVDVNPPRGTRDFPPEDMRLRTWLFDQFREVSRLMAFEEVDFPVLESEALFIRKAGEEITQQLYNFEDKGGRRVVLRPEITPSLARLIIKQGKSVSLPLKWFTIGQCWRYERMTRGRRREHYQWNMDIFGVPKVRAEAELLQAIVLLFQRLGITSSDVGIRVSSRKVLQAVLNMYSIPEHLFTEVCVIVDKLGKLTRDEIEKELMSTGLSSEAVQGIIEVLSLKSLSKLEEVLGSGVEAVADLKKLFSFAEQYGYADWICFDASVVRGLAYYTGIVFEAFDREGKLRAICGGGRYDRLLSTFGSEDIPACGFGFGDAVIVESLKDQHPVLLFR